MELKTLTAIFTTVFIAELGDKTQLATILFSADGGTSRLAVFIAASTALVASTLVAVLLGSSFSGFLNRRVLSIAAGCGFILIGIWTLVGGIKNNV